MNIPFNKPYVPDKARSNLDEALASAHHSGDGLFSKRAEAFLENLTGSARHLLTPSCTSALELAVIALEIGPGDEVIVPSFTFTSTANAIVMSGATPVFVDVSPENFSIDPDKIEAAIGPNTKAIIVVHYAGISAEMKKILEISKHFGIHVIEDNAHGLGGSYENHQLGSMGILATQSFHETKNIQCGEGGSIAVNDLNLIERIEIIREKGTDRSKFFRGAIEKYTWVDKGSSWVQSDLLASLLCGQLEDFEDIQTKRHKIWNFYLEGLGDWGLENNVRVPYLRDGSKHTAHIFYLVFETEEKRSLMQEKLQLNGISAPFHYQPLHSSAAGRKYGKSVGEFSGTEIGANRLLRLPIWYKMSEIEMNIVVEVIRNCS